MKYLIIFFSFAFIFSCDKQNTAVTKKVSGKNNADADITLREKTPDSIKIIRNIFTEIQQEIKSGKLKKASKPFECVEQSGFIDFYYDRNKLKKLVFSKSDSHFTQIQEFYLNDKKVVFIFIKEISWSFVGSKTDKERTKDEIIEKRFYINENRNAFLCLEKSYTVYSDDQHPVINENIPNTTQSSCDTTEYFEIFEKIITENKNEKAGCL